MASKFTKTRAARWFSLAALVAAMGSLAQLEAEPRPTSGSSSTNRAQAQPSQSASVAPSPTKRPSEPVGETDRLQPKVRLGKLPGITLGPRKPVGSDTVARIKKCIAALAEIDSPEFGLSPTITGAAFLPLPGQSQAGAMLLTDHHLKPSDALSTLVEIGPDALPFLLDALSDKTPTKLTIEHNADFGGMWLANELRGNPANKLEAGVLAKNDSENDSACENSIEKYTVKVGDVCFVAIGQIVGRQYQAVRYQPTACIVINSPTEDPKLRQQIRAIWSSNDPATKLFDSLLLDYSTHLQISAAMRLLYYFPRETASLIADRLKKLNVGRSSQHGSGSPATDSELESYMRREAANGGGTSDFIKAVSWSREPAVRAAIRDIFGRTTDVDILLAALPSGQEFDRQLVRDRLSQFLDGLSPQDPGPYGDGYNLLVALAEHFGKDAAPMFDRYLKNASAQRCYSVAQALQLFRGDWCTAILIRLLSDQRPVEGYTYAISPTVRDSDRLTIRVCDAAADTLHLYRKKLPWSMQGDYKNLDNQIDAIRERLAKRQRE